MSALRDGQFATAAPQVHHECGRTIHAPARNKAKVNEPGLFHARDNLDSPARCGPYPLQKCLGIARLPQCAGRSYTHTVGHDLLRGTMESAKNLHRFCDGIGSKESRPKNALAQTRDSASVVEGAETAALESCNLEPDGVGADINRSKRGHGEGSQFTCAGPVRHRWRLFARRRLRRARLCGRLDPLNERWTLRTHFA